MFQRVKFLAKKRGLSINRVEEDLGLSKNTLYRLKVNVPTSERLKQLADYFNVTTDYLLGIEENTHDKLDNDIGSKLDQMLEQLTSEQEALMFRGKMLDDETKQLVLSAMSHAVELAELRLKERR